MSRPLLNRRLEGLGTTIFAEMSARAVATGSINLGQGFPDRDGPAKIAQAAADAILAGRGNQYPPGPGIPELRQAIAAHDERFYGLRYDPDDEILVTAGATEAIAAAMLALVEPGDEVIAFEPYYDSYAANIAMAGGVRVPVTLRPPDFRPDLDELAKAITTHQAHPAQQPAQPDRLGLHPRRARRHRARWPSSATCSWSPTRSTSTWSSTASTCRSPQFPGMRERTVSVSSAGKTFSFTGWKIGWVKATPELVTAVKTAKQFLTFVSGGPFQYAVAEALALPDEYYARLRDDLKAQRDLLCAGPARDRLRGVPAAGHLLRHRRHQAGWATRTASSSAGPCPTARAWSPSPPPIFYDHKEAARSHVRFAFCKRPEVLTEALARLSRLTHFTPNGPLYPPGRPAPRVPAAIGGSALPRIGSQAHGGAPAPRPGWE